MRLLFVSGTTTGGSAVSTHELAWALAARGHSVGILVRERARARSGLVAPAPTGPLNSLRATSERTLRALRRVVRTTPGTSTPAHGVDVWTSSTPQRVLEQLCSSFHPDVAIVSSVPRNAWAQMRAALRRSGVPSVLYVREAATLEHVPIADLRPDLTLTNSAALRDAVALLGIAASSVPSMIDFGRCEVVSSRASVLFVNPIRSRGLAIAVALAADNPDVPFAFQLSWPLDRRDERALRAEVAVHSNVELRGHESDPARIYRDARVLLLPYHVDQRPRVVAEAQWNGIPVVASDLPGHREAVGDGGVLVPLDASRASWSTALRSIWDADDGAQRLGAAARAHAARAEQDGERVVRRFEELMTALVSGAGLS
ncbi:MAG: glycosyltransferase [Acidimicrobiia bacterium]